MTKLFFFSFCFACLATNAQNDTDLSKARRLTDSFSQHIDSQIRNMREMQDSFRTRELDRNVNALNEFVQMQNERQKKQGKQMYIRIGLGVLFFVVLIVGLRRKKKTGA